MEEKRSISDKFYNVFIGENWVETTKRIVVYLFLFAFFGIYTVITDDKYFNITITRYEFFMFISLLFSGSVLLLCIMEALYNKANYIKKDVYTIKMEKWYKRPEFWMEAFLMSNVYACIVSISARRSGAEDISLYERYPSLLGQDGRYMGLLTYLVIAIVFLIIARGIKLHMWIFMVFAVSVLYSYIIGVFQHCGLDFMGYRERVSRPEIFISTFGNINIFASFLSMSVPVFMAMYIFSKKKLYRVVGGVLTVLAGMCLIAANSDSGFLGVGISVFVLFVFSVKDGAFARFFETILMLLVGITGLVAINEVIDFKNDRGGIAQVVQNVPVMVLITLGMLLIYIVYRLMRKKYDLFFSGIDRKRCIIYIIVFVCLLGVIITAVGILNHWSAFTFDRKWGNYRGMIWNICVDIYKDAPMVNKIFGYGNETLRILTVDGYYDEMIKYTERIYDNAHNEVLQYLLTTGLVGAISYIGLFVTSLWYTIKHSGKKVISYICIVAMVGYFSQGLVNINQPITTPYFFLFMALGVGYVKGLKKKEVQRD